MNPQVDRGLASALATLGLRPDADARAVRRAYAQQLKQIDQATELQAFQALRQAYEQALHGVARRDAQVTEAAPSIDVVTSAVMPAVVPATATPLHDSGELAQAVFKPFAARAAAGFRDEADAADALQQALADDRLLNIEARTIFEWQVAQLLMNGWQQGHEFLFGPACLVFDWEKDRAHLRIFGQLGAMLDAAISEKLMFRQQPPQSFELQRSAIRRLRQTEMPPLALRRADLPLVQMLVQRYPNWLRIVTSQANINIWFASLPDDPAASAANAALAASSPLSPRRSGWKFLSRYQVWFALVSLIALLNVMAPSKPTPRWQPPAATSQQARVPSGASVSTWPPNASPNTLLGQPGVASFDAAKAAPKPFTLLLPPDPQPRDMYGLPTPSALLAPMQRRSAAPPTGTVIVNASAAGLGRPAATAGTHAASAPVPSLAPSPKPSPRTEP